jgi:Mlc titration factor MtfA (ptsG expression regulator)
MHILVAIQQTSSGGKIIIGIFVFILILMMLHYTIRLIELGYVMRNKKPLYLYFYPFLRTLTQLQKSILINQFSFYNKLTEKEQKYFEHRVASFLKDKDFIGRDNLKISDEMRVLISSTAVMLTFGFRDFYIGLIDKIFVYPKEFYSRANDDYHKGEFNPKLETLVLSWEDFIKGFQTSDDNINLGIHEFAHAIHLNSTKERDVSSTIFSDSFKELTDLLTNDSELRETLITSEYFREYGYTNQYEFVAVIIETFIETPKKFRNQFPTIYSKTKQMLNFNFAGY